MVQSNSEITSNKAKSERPSLIGLIYSPSEQFEKIRKRPTFWIPLLVITVLFAIGSYFSISQLDYADLLGDNIPADQMAAVMTISKIIGAISSLFVPLITVVISAAFYLLVAKIAGAKVTYKQVLSMKLFIMFIAAIGIIVDGLYRVVTDNSLDTTITSVAGIIGSNNAVLGTIELFNIWGVILTAIGLQRVATLSKRLSWAVAIIFYLISLGFAYISTILSTITSL